MSCVTNQAERGEADWLFHAGFTSFYDSLDHGHDDHGWSDATRTRYKTSLRQIGVTLAEIFEERGDDIELAGAWEVDLKTITEFVALRKDEGVSIATINRDLTAFNHLMSHIRNKGWIEMNPVLQFEKQGMKENLPDIVLPTDAAIEKLSQRAPGTLVFFPGFLDATGGRVTEISMIKWSDVNGIERPVEGHVTLTLRHTKGRKVRTITLRQQAIDILREIRRSNRSPYVFWNKTEDGFYRSAANLFWDYAQETGFGARLHDIRHKFAIERLKEGWSVYRVQRYIGQPKGIIECERLARKSRAFAFLDSSILCLLSEIRQLDGIVGACGDAKYRHTMPSQTLDRRIRAGGSAS